MIQSDIVTVLLADSLVTDIVSARIYPLRMPQDAALPAIVYQRISTTPVTSLDGDSNLDNVRMQFTCWASSYSAVLDLAWKLRYALQNSSYKIITNLELDTEDPETRAYGIIVDVSVWASVEDVVPPVDEFFLLETADFLLLEDSEKIVLEV